MKRSVLFLALCMASASARGQIVDPISAVAPEVHFGVHGNFTLSDLPGPAISGTGALGDAYGTGWGGGVHVDLSFLAFSFRLSGDYLAYALDADRFRASYEGVFGPAVSQLGVEGGDLTIYGVSLHGKLNLVPIPVVTPYVTAGVGMAWLELEETKTSIAGVAGRTFPARSDAGRTTLGVGLGADVSIGVDLFVEGRYVWILTEGERSTYVPVTVGVTF